MPPRNKPVLPANTAWKRAARSVLNWWLEELASMLPLRFRNWWRGTGGIALLALRGQRLAFCRPTDGGIEEVFATEIHEAALSTPVATVRQRLAKAFGQNHQLFLLLPSDQVLQRTLSLPAVVAENLRQTLGFELDRYTPFRQDQAYFDYRIAERPKAVGAGDGSSLTIELVVASRHSVDKQIETIGRVDLSVGGVVVEDDFASPGRPFRNLSPIAPVLRTPMARFRRRLAFAVGSCVLLAAALVIPIWQKRSAAIELLAPVAEAKAAAENTDSLRDRLGKLVEEHDFVLNKKWDSPSATLMLEEMTKLMPDDTFVMQMDFDGKTVEVRGETGSAAGMVAILEASPLFKDVAFKAPLTKVQGTTFDRFQIGATLEGMGYKPVSPDADVANRSAAPGDGASKAAPTPAPGGTRPATTPPAVSLGQPK